mgnify:CR=1 FL=1
MTRPPEVEEPLSPASRGWLAGTTAEDRKKSGQYMTPRRVADALLSRVDLSLGMRVLDPGVGTGELLAAAARRCDGLELFGWDIDDQILAACAVHLPGVELEKRSALEPWSGEMFDLVIGNPPFFQLRPGPDLKQRYAGVISGRANIFAFFFQAGLELLRPGGQLAYVVPPSLNSGAYFEGLREHITRVASIEGLVILEGTDLFEGANTAVQLIVLRKHGPGLQPTSDFRFEKSCPDSGFRRVVFSADPDRLAGCFEGRRTLWELGFAAHTGTIVWNQHRKRLVRTASKETVPLIWSHNLRDGEIDFGNRSEKPQYILPPGPVEQGPAVLVNRVVGSVGKGELRVALVPEGATFLVENHVNVIRPRPGAVPKVDWQELKRMLADPGAAQRVRLLTGNTQISATELTQLLPLG